MKNLLTNLSIIAISVILSVWIVGSSFGGGVGASITTLTGTDQLSDFPTTYNANLNALNDNKFELSDWYATTTKPNLSTVGTITTGTWNADTIAEIYGGTGQSTYTTGDILYSDGSNSLAKLGIGSNGETLQISGGLPVWQSGTVNETLNYTWTGDHLWQAGASSTQFSVFDMAWIGGTATSTFASNGDATIGNNLTVNGTGNITGNVTFGGNLTVSSQSSTTDMIISGTCTGCTSGWERVTATDQPGSGATADATASCTGDNVLMGGGWSTSQENASNAILRNGPASDTSWQAKLDQGAGVNGTLTVYAICVDP